MKAYKSSLLFFLLFALTQTGACQSSKTIVGAASPTPPTVNTGTTARRGGTVWRDYSDPDGDFSIQIPDGWTVEREELDGAFMTVIHPQQQQRAANLSIMTIKVVPPPNDSAELQSNMLVESSRPFFSGWLDGLAEQAKVKDASEGYRTRFDKFNALRLDVTYHRDDAEDPRRGYGIYFIGDRTTFFLTLTAGRSQFKALEEILSTVRIEP